MSINKFQLLVTYIIEAEIRSRRKIKEITNHRALMTVCAAHVQSHIKFAFIGWCPIYFNHSTKNEFIQKQFIMFRLRRIYPFNYQCLYMTCMYIPFNKKYRFLNNFFCHFIYTLYLFTPIYHQWGKLNVFKSKNCNATESQIIQKCCKSNDKQR